jgi:hypothetical protein
MTPTFCFTASKPLVSKLTLGLVNKPHRGSGLPQRLGIQKLPTRRALAYTIPY